MTFWLWPETDGEGKGPKAEVDSTLQPPTLPRASLSCIYQYLQPAFSHIFRCIYKDLGDIKVQVDRSLKARSGLVLQLSAVDQMCREGILWDIQVNIFRSH
ncbi:MAG: hypothetical protein CL912_23205 [Deltaproteobacteria bacterium]|nr:hypothetical protein [Deltaproteobacteria bacterium]